MKNILILYDSTNGLKRARYTQIFKKRKMNIGKNNRV